LLIDHHILFREGLRHILQQLPDAEILEAGSFSAGLKLAGQHPDLGLVMLELESPGSVGAISVKVFRQFYPHIPLLVVSSMEDRSVKTKVLEYGASGFVGKSSTGALLLDALHQALISGVNMPPVHEHGSECHMISCMGDLTPRQMDVLKCMAEGLSNKEIAETINLAMGTVKLHVAAVYRTLRVKNRMEVIRIARRCGLSGMSHP